MNFESVRRVSERQREFRQFVKKKQIVVIFYCVGPVIDNEFRHSTVKVAVDPQTHKKLTLIC